MCACSGRSSLVDHGLIGGEGMAERLGTHESQGPRGRHAEQRRAPDLERWKRSVHGTVATYSSTTCPLESIPIGNLPGKLVGDVRRILRRRVGSRLG